MTREEGRYGEFGGQFVPETLMKAVIELNEAYAKYMKDPEFLTELESIVEAGTKIDIRYFIDEILDDDQQEDLNSYFMELEEDDIELAIQELGADYDEETIRLARVKFISDMGN